MNNTFILKFILFVFLCSTNVYPAVIRTRLPSEVAGDKGLAVRIDIPNEARYSGNHAPVVVYLGGGFRGECLFKRETDLDEHGFVEIRFNFPGSGTEDNISGGGPYDHRGPKSLIAARDAIRFGMNLQADSSGHRISELIYPIIPMSNNVGLIGWSNGGNTNICVAGIHGEKLPHLAWIVNWESPVGDGMPQAETGAKSENQLRPFNPVQNDAYNALTGLWDLSSLAFNSEIRIPILDHTHLHVQGSLYFDFNHDGIVNLGSDFIVYPLVFNINNEWKSYYSERLINNATSKNLFSAVQPNHVFTIEETHDFWLWRNGEYWIDSVVVKNSELLFMIVANDTDHVQRSPDHPHVLNQYQRFLNAQCRFVRLNPDKIHIKEMYGYTPPGTVDNDAFMTVNFGNIKSAVEPGNAEDHFGKVVIAAAGACELADRTYYNVMDINLSSILTVIETRPNKTINFILQQNHPNPFNSSTQISYSISNSGFVILKVYDILGREIQTLVNEYQNADTYTVNFDASKILSGIYLYRLNIGNKYSEIEKMTVMK